MKPRMIELFCGAGLFGHAFNENGFEALFSADLDHDAISSLQFNSKHKKAVVHDATKVLSIEADIIIAGPPCQGFSTLGKRDSKDKRNQLSLVLIDWAKASGAQVIVIENVPQFQKSPQFDILKRAFAKLGFEFDSWRLNAVEFGVPQKRERSFTIFSKKGLPNKPSPQHLTSNVRQAFANLSINENDPMHFIAPISKTAKERYENIPEKGGKMDLLRRRPDLCPESWVKLGIQAVDVWGRMDFDKPSNTIRCSFQNPSKGRYIHPTENRVITLREGARLQGVPDEWVFSGSRTSIARQIGNGVPLGLGRAVANEIAQIF